MLLVQRKTDRHIRQGVINIADDDNWLEKYRSDPLEWKPVTDIYCNPHQLSWITHGFHRRKKKRFPIQFCHIAVLMCLKNHLVRAKEVV